jgi:hypothetical protein
MMIVNPIFKINRYVLVISLSWKIPAQAELENSSSSRAELGHFNFRAETELTICTSLCCKFFKFPNFASIQDSNQFHDHLPEFL